jgi:hypothetical protein
MKLKFTNLLAEGCFINQVMMALNWNPEEKVCCQSLILVGLSTLIMLNWVVMLEWWSCQLLEIIELYEGIEYKLKGH